MNTEQKHRTSSPKGETAEGGTNGKKRNYQQELDRILELQKGTRPRLLLHSCCGPCSSAVLEYLTQFFEVSLFWFNPNIYPQAEFDCRLLAQEELLRKMGIGARCTECFRLRLREAAQTAAEEGFGWYCSTLTLSRHKDPVRINALGEQFAAEFGVRWLPSEFKKRGRELRSRELCEEYGIYRQNYCGCEYSLKTSEQHNMTSEV